MKNKMTILNKYNTVLQMYTRLVSHKFMIEELFFTSRPNLRAVDLYVSGT